MTTTADPYHRMSETTRRAVINYVIDQGRYLQGEEEWSMEDNFQTTEGLAALYQDHILPLEHTPDPEADVECDDSTLCPAGDDEHAPDCPRNYTTHDLETREGEYARDLALGVYTPEGN